MYFLSLIEDLDIRINPKRSKPIWIAKFNFLSLLRVCESFMRFNHLRNMNEGTELGEGVVKDLRPLTAKGVGAQWATNLLLAYYRCSTLSMLLEAVQHTNSCIKRGDIFSRIREYLDESKIKCLSTMPDAMHLLQTGQLLPLVLYGSENKWKAGVVIVAQNHWFFGEIVFEKGSSTSDVFGLPYYQAHLGEETECLAGDVIEISTTIRISVLDLWHYVS
jgi:hypothetical protein